jgi:hypothetical protein
MELLDARIKECTNFDAMYSLVRVSGKLMVPTDPRLHKRNTEAARETDEPNDIYANRITLRSGWVKLWKGQGTSIGGRNKFPRDLLKKPRGHLTGIRFEVLVTFNEKCGNCRGEYTRLEKGK